MSNSRSEIGWSDANRIVIRGHDLAGSLMGRVPLGDVAFLVLTGQLPNPRESVVFDAMLVALVDHGITPSALVSRLTHLGAPESLQGAVAAGILGLGDRFVGTIEGSARMLQQALEAEVSDISGLADGIVRDFRSRGEFIPGLGHPVHKDSDPRTTRLFALAKEHDLAGRHVGLMQALEGASERAYSRRLPINVTGAVGALAGELGIGWDISRGVGLVARTIGLLGHVTEEMRSPIARQVWSEAEARHRSHEPGGL